MPPAFAAVTPETASSTSKQDRGAAAELSAGGRRSPVRLALFERPARDVDVEQVEQRLPGSIQSWVIPCSSVSSSRRSLPIMRFAFLDDEAAATRTPAVCASRSSRRPSGKALNSPASISALVLLLSLGVLVDQCRRVWHGEVLERRECAVVAWPARDYLLVNLGVKRSGAQVLSLDPAPASVHEFPQRLALGPLVRRVNEYPVDVEARSLEPFPLAARNTAIGARSTR